MLFEYRLTQQHRHLPLSTYKKRVFQVFVGLVPFATTIAITTMHNKTPVSRESMGKKSIRIYVHTYVRVCMYECASAKWNTAQQHKNNTSEWHRELKQERIG